MKKSNFSLSLSLIILGISFTQGQLSAMKRNQPVSEVRERLQKKVQARHEEHEKLQRLATILALEKELMEEASKFIEASKNLEEANDIMLNTFGSEATLSEGAIENRQVRPNRLQRSFYLEKPEHIAFILQYPEKLDSEFYSKNPEMIQKLLNHTEPEIQIMGKMEYIKYLLFCSLMIKHFIWVHI